MAYEIGQMVHVIVAGNPFPGRVLDGPQHETITIPAKPATDRFAAKPARTIEATWQNVVSLRTTNPANGEVTEFLTISRERTDEPRFTAPRTKPVEGLDATEKGEVITLDEISEAAVLSMAAFQREKLAATAEAELAL